MNNNEIVVLVESKLLEGVTREDIFRELGGTDDVARVIASTPDFQLRQKYAKLNWILVAIVTYLGLLKFVLYLPEFINTHFSLYFLPVLLMIPSAAIYFALQIRKFRGGCYGISGLLLVAVIVKNIRTLDSLMIDVKSFMIWLVILIPLIAGCIIAFFLKMKLCPYLGWLGAKTDSAGKYKFINNESLLN